MKIVTFEVHDQERIGALEDDTVVDLSLVHRLYLSEQAKEGKYAPKRFPRIMIDFLQLGEGVGKYASNLVAWGRGLSERRSVELRQQSVLLNIVCAVIALTKSLVLELTQYNVTVDVIPYGLIETDKV